MKGKVIVKEIPPSELFSMVGQIVLRTSGMVKLKKVLGNDIQYVYVDNPTLQLTTTIKQGFFKPVFENLEGEDDSRYLAIRQSEYPKLKRMILAKNGAILTGAASHENPIVYGHQDILGEVFFSDKKDGEPETFREKKKKKRYV